MQSKVKKVLTVSDVAEYLGLHPSTVYRLVRSGEVPGFKIGNSWRFNLEDIDSWRFGRVRRRAAGKPDKQNQP